MGALIGVSATPAQRRRSAVETILGVALGIGIADALVVLIGDGTLQLAAIVAGATVAPVPKLIRARTKPSRTEKVREQHALADRLPNRRGSVLTTSAPREPDRCACSPKSAASGAHH